jgi:hypothetical protein
MHEERPRRQQKRLRLGGSVRLLIDTADGLVITNGQIIDVSEGGCAVHVHRPIDVNLVGRVSVEVAGQALGLPVRTRWSRADTRGWIVGCQFDRPTPEKLKAIRALMLERKKLTA